ncbi:hypothetical protein IWW50_002106 [Coemansia erecta]|nr:hypothetical protein IWW50_002106 [Coemansia erecta]
MPTATPPLIVKQYSIDSTQAGEKLRAYLIHKFHGVFVRADTIALLRQKRVRVNGEIVLDSYILQAGDCVQVEIDALQTIKGRLRGLEVELKYSEPGLVVLLKEPGINKQTVEWAAAAMEVTKSGYEGPVPECNELSPWIAVNEVEKGMRMFIILVNTTERQEAMLRNISEGRVRFTICALCHGNVDQSVFSQTTAKAMADLAKKTSQLSVNAGDCSTSALDPYDAWFRNNHLRPDIFDHVAAEVISVTQSSTAGHLSMVQATTSHTGNPSLVVRRFMLELGFPVAGSQNHAKPLTNHKDKGTLQAFVKAEFPSLADNEAQVAVDECIPPKLLNVCLREVKFFDRRKEKARVEVEKQAALDSPDSGVDLVNGKPAAYISGHKEFCGTMFRVTPDTLIPRPSTETLVEAAISFVNKRTNRKTTAKIMDLGTGSGCILLSVLLQTLSTNGIGIDISTSALSVAQDNCKQHNLGKRAEFVHGSFETFTLDPHIVSCGPFDFIACNPPYVSSVKLSRMRAAIEHEPALALVADNGGYQAYRDIHTALTANMLILAPGGSIGFEIGKDMESGVRRIFADWTEVAAIKDTNGFLRVLVFQPPALSSE